MTAPKLWSRRFLDARMILKRTMAATNEEPPSMGGRNSSPEAQQKEIPASVASYILTWGKATGAVLVRFGGLEKEIDRKELASAVEAMKATLNDCNLLLNLLCSLSEVKREDTSPTTRRELPELTNEQKPATSAEERERYKLVFLACRDRIRRALVAASMLGADGSKNITVKAMKDFLRLRSQPTSGKKHELAKRIFDLPELEEVPVEGPLAAAYNIEGDDDLDAGGDDESVE
jgi:hypothetical protein